MRATASGWLRASSTTSVAGSGAPRRRSSSPRADRDARPAGVRGRRRRFRRDAAGQRAVEPERPDRGRASGSARAGLRARPGRRRADPRSADVRLHSARADRAATRSHAEVARPGRRVQLLDGSMVADGVEVVRARALRVMTAECGGGHSAEIPPPPGPQGGRVQGASRAAPTPVRHRRGRSPVHSRRVRQRPCDRLVSPRDSPGRERAAVGAAAPGRGQRLRRRAEWHAPTRGLPVHQPRPDAVRRARAGRRVDLPRVPDAARPGGHRRCRKRALRRARPRRPGHPGAASRAPLRRRRADRTAVRPPPESPARARRSRWPT